MYLYNKSIKIHGEPMDIFLLLTIFLWNKFVWKTCGVPIHGLSMKNIETHSLYKSIELCGFPMDNLLDGFISV